MKGGSGRRALFCAPPVLPDMNYIFKFNGKPFFSIGGQTNNSSSACAERMARDCRAAQKMGMNTIAAAVTWELLEPSEGS